MLQAFLYKIFINEKIIISKTEININDKNITLTIPYYPLNNANYQKPSHHKVMKQNYHIYDPKNNPLGLRPPVTINRTPGLTPGGRDNKITKNQNLSEHDQRNRK